MDPLADALDRLVSTHGIDSVLLALAGVAAAKAQDFEALGDADSAAYHAALAAALTVHA